MITVYVYEEWLNNKKIAEYSCPYCYKPIKWEIGVQMSPFRCPGCREELLDLTKIIANENWRVAYHIQGEISVGCTNSSVA